MRAGVTLVELLVVLAILGLFFAITGLSLATLRAPRELAHARALNEARVRAIHSGRPMRVALDSLTAASSTAASPTALFLPDGRAIGPGLDPLTGEPLRAHP